MEFPAVGWRNNDSSGTLYYAGVYGLYWSSVAYDSNYAYRLYFSSSDLGVIAPVRRNGFSVRCVR
ncbi:MAG: fibrobacter succinogenes major paralogous domain-containing protein [Rikenellaceae bacterium]|nr:fibrobacter succinogenes major paralogous domain-containing protein [Rikenellaceae bacterium]MDE7134241.1 fibrobacter succinogenes major paralogous domain-containing protein [Rikenellaceae bacterium]MDE7356723.1 fibrobacter succinogenes major paralogous domain-containing protein [Rikenellaceae bacterium]